MFPRGSEPSRERVWDERERLEAAWCAQESQTLFRVVGWRVQGWAIARYVNGEKDKDRLKEFELKRSLLCPGVHQKALSR